MTERTDAPEQRMTPKQLIETVRGVLSAVRHGPGPVAVVVNNNQPGTQHIVETAPNVTLDVGTALYVATPSERGTSGGKIAEPDLLLADYYAAYPHGRLGERYRALKPSPASGEQINAAESPKQPAVEQADVPRGQSVDDQQNDVASPAAPNTAPQMSAAATLPVTPAVEAGQPAAAVPDDPVAVYDKLYCAELLVDGDRDVGSEAIRALAAHYLRRAPEGYALVPLEPTDDMLVAGVDAFYVAEDSHIATRMYKAMLAAAKQEADR